MTMQLSGNGTITGLAVGGLPAGTVDAATLASAAVTPPKLTGGQSGSAPLIGPRAFCFFNGTTAGTNAPTYGTNIATIERLSTGRYRATLTTAMPSANYVFFGNTFGNSASVTAVTQDSSFVQTTTQFQFWCTSGWADGSVAGVVKDATGISLIVIG